MQFDLKITPGSLQSIKSTSFESHNLYDKLYQKEENKIIYLQTQNAINYTDKEFQLTPKVL